MHISPLFTVTQLVSPPDVFTPIYSLRPMYLLQRLPLVIPLALLPEEGSRRVGLGVIAEVGDKVGVDVGVVVCTAPSVPHDEMMAATRRATAPRRATFTLTLMMWSKTMETCPLAGSLWMTKRCFSKVVGSLDNPPIKACHFH